MNATKWLVLMLCLLAMAGVPNGLYAAAGDVSVEFPGYPTCNKSGPPPLDLTMSCPSSSPVITISAISASSGNGKPRIELTPGSNDGNADSLRMVNTRITANQSIPNEDFQIKFYRQHVKGPVTPPAVYYKVSVTGTLGPPNDQTTNANSITVHGFVKDLSATNPADIAVGNLNPNPYVVQCDGSTCTSNITNTASGTQWSGGPLAGDRILTVLFSIRLWAVGNYLDLSSYGIKINSQGGPDRPCPPIKPCKGFQPIFEKKLPVPPAVLEKKPPKETQK
jgi:hypothetical protein